MLRVLGEGGMGAAHLALDTRLNRQCVIKEILVRTPEGQRQFEREAEILANLDHPNLPKVWDIIDADGQPYIIMQYIEGQTINRLASERSAPLEIHDVLRWAKEILSAVQYLHAKNPPVIHRDIKPQNVCISPENKAYLLDFGIARRLDESHTRTSAQAVTHNYSPIEQHPEQSLLPMPSVLEYVRALHAEGLHTHFYSDVYGVGATLYYALTLLPPTDACMRVLGEVLPLVLEKNNEVPKFLAAAVMKALELHPRNRYQSAAEMMAALQPKSVEAPAVSVRKRPARPLPASNIRLLDRELIYIQAGVFRMGSDDPEVKAACHPSHSVELGAYCISQFPVTNLDYQHFIEDNPDYPIPQNPMRYAQRYNWDPATRTFPRGLEDHPVVLVSWQDAINYCRWLRKVTGYEVRLPTEAEWEKAASWDQLSSASRLYPWGNQFEEDKCNVDVRGELRLQTSAVGRYSPAGDSFYGLADMAGNVWEWTGSLYLPYPYEPTGEREEGSSEEKRVVRGGAYDESPLMARCAWRHVVQPGLRLANVGFRVVCNAA